jgi:hypothetical protein
MAFAFGILAGIDFTLLPIRTFRVSGSVYDAVNGRPGHARNRLADAPKS